MDLLFVEDEAAVANLYLPYFEKSGWRTHWVTTVGAGIAAVLQRSYDAVLLDLLLKEQGHPDGDGLDVLRAMRAHGLQTPVVICSSYGTERRATELGEEFGVVTVLAKPVDTRTLLMCLAAAAAARTPHDALVEAEAELALLDFAHVSSRDQCVGVLLRAMGDRALLLREWAAVCESAGACLAATSPPPRETLATLLATAAAIRRSPDSVLEMVLSVLANTSVPNEAELARLCELSVKVMRKTLIDGTGHGFNWWRRMSRLRRFVIALLRTSERTTQCAHRAGYPEPRHAWRDCCDFLGITADAIRGLARAAPGPL